MKKLFCLVALWMAFSGQAFAFPVHAQVSITSSVVQATVVNHYGRRMVCRGFAYGRTNLGHVANAWMNNLVVYPGQHAFVYVYTNPWQFGPFVQGWANIACRFF